MEPLALAGGSCARTGRVGQAQRATTNTSEATERTRSKHWRGSVSEASGQCEVGVLGKKIRISSKQYRQLYKKYKLTKEEVGFIESMIRPMNSFYEQ